MTVLVIVIIVVVVAFLIYIKFKSGQKIKDTEAKHENLKEKIEIVKEVKDETDKHAPLHAIDCPIFTSLPNGFFIRNSDSVF